MTQKRHEEGIFIGLFIGTGKLGLCVHEASFFSRLWKQALEPVFLQLQTTTPCIQQAKINLNNYPKSPLTVLKSEIHLGIILNEFAYKNSINPG